MDLSPSHEKEAAEDLITIPKNPVSHRTRSFSCSSSSSSSSLSSISSSSSTTNSPSTPTSPLRLSGIPFSWEQQPGIPKETYSPTSKESTPSQDLLLPLPPAAPSTMIRKKKSLPTLEKDPFMAALMECSKDHHHIHLHQHQQLPLRHVELGAKVSRSLSDRFGSCMRTCSVMESTVRLNRAGYHLLDRRSG